MGVFLTLFVCSNLQWVNGTLIHTYFRILHFNVTIPSTFTDFSQCLFFFIKDKEKNLNICFRDNYFLICVLDFFIGLQLYNQIEDNTIVLFIGGKQMNLMLLYMCLRLLEYFGHRCTMSCCCQATLHLLGKLQM